MESLPTTTLFGSKSAFAIEYAPSIHFSYGFLRLWIHDRWVGDISMSLQLETAAFYLRRLIGDPNYSLRFFYRTESEVPDHEFLRSQGGWSFGESFDHFSLIYYRITDVEIVSFSWDIYPLFKDRHPDFCGGYDLAGIPMSVVAPAVADFLNVIQQP